MTAFEYLCGLPILPHSAQEGVRGQPSRSEVKRWLRTGSVLLNGAFPQPSDEIEFPITSLVFFPKSPRRRTTMVMESKEEWRRLLETGIVVRIGIEQSLVPIHNERSRTTEME